MTLNFRKGYEVRSLSTDFARIMTLLRKERRVSQKKAAEDLGVSQGLLSHYEKGKRECGLDFLVRAADYYNVSCDYLLGRSPEPEGKTITVDELPDEDPNQREKVTKSSMMIAFNKKLILNSLNVFFSILSKCGSATVIKEASAYLMLAIYKVFRFTYSANPKNDQNFFMIDKASAPAATDAAMSLAQAKLSASVQGVALPGEDAITDSQELSMTSQTLAEEYPKYYSSMVNLIKNSESRIKSLSSDPKSK